MNEFVVTSKTNKHKVKVKNQNLISLDGKDKSVSLSKLSDYSYLLKVDDKVYQITTQKNNGNGYFLNVDGYSYEISVRTLLEEKAFEYLKNKAKENHSAEIKSPMPGLVLKLKKKVGDQVEIGDSLLILEAMKMENDIKASSSGIIKEIYVNENAAVEKNEKLILIG